MCWKREVLILKVSQEKTKELSHFSNGLDQHGKGNNWFLNVIRLYGCFMFIFASLKVSII